MAEYARIVSRRVQCILVHDLKYDDRQICEQKGFKSMGLWEKDCF